MSLKCQPCKASRACCALVLAKRSLSKDTVPGLVDPTCLNLDLSLRTSTLELAVDSESGCTCACCTVLLKSKQKFVVCQADRPVLKCIKFIAELH